MIVHGFQKLSLCFHNNLPRGLHYNVEKTVIAKLNRLVQIWLVWNFLDIKLQIEISKKTSSQYSCKQLNYVQLIRVYNTEIWKKNFK